MNDESRYILDGLLADWHHWSTGYALVAGLGSSAMFRNAKSPRGYESEGEIADATIHNSTMEAINFHVFELAPIHRTAIQINARNLCTGRAVWISPRLPKNMEERAILLMEARNALLARLVKAGVV